MSACRRFGCHPGGDWTCCWHLVDRGQGYGQACFGDRAAPTPALGVHVAELRSSQEGAAIAAAIL